MSYRDETSSPRLLGLSEAMAKPVATWAAASGREPHLDELLDDPIMTLLWRGDRLEPRSARATVLGLREVVRRRHDELELLEA